MYLKLQNIYTRILSSFIRILDDFFAWLETLPVSGKSKLAGAIRYALNERKYLYTFLENGDVPIDNNRAENAIRPLRPVNLAVTIFKEMKICKAE